MLKKAGYRDLRAKLMAEPSADVDFDVILSEAETGALSVYGLGGSLLTSQSILRQSRAEVLTV